MGMAAAGCRAVADTMTVDFMVITPPLARARAPSKNIPICTSDDDDVAKTNVARVVLQLEAFSTLVEQAGKLRYMSGGATSVPMVMR